MNFENPTSGKASLELALDKQELEQEGSPAREKLGGNLSEFLSQETQHLRQLVENEDAKHRNHWAKNKGAHLFPDLPFESGNHSVMGYHYAELLDNAVAAQEAAENGRYEMVFTYIESQFLEAANGQSSSLAELKLLRALEYQLCEEERLTLPTPGGPKEAVGISVEGHDHHQAYANEDAQHMPDKDSQPSAEFAEGNPEMMLSRVERILADTATHRLHVEELYRGTPGYEHEDDYKMAAAEVEAQHADGKSLDDFVHETRGLWASLYATLLSREGSPGYVSRG